MNDPRLKLTCVGHRAPTMLRQLVKNHFAERKLVKKLFIN